jgi:hypothetical protein
VEAPAFTFPVFPDGNFCVRILEICSVHEDANEIKTLREALKILERNLTKTRAALAELEARLKWSHSKKAENDTEFLIRQKTTTKPKWLPEILP